MTSGETKFYRTPKNYDRYYLELYDYPARIIKGSCAWRRRKTLEKCEIVMFSLKQRAQKREIPSVSFPLVGDELTSSRHSHKMCVSIFSVVLADPPSLSLSYKEVPIRPRHKSSAGPSLHWRRCRFTDIYICGDFTYLNEVAIFMYDKPVWPN